MIELKGVSFQYDSRFKEKCLSDINLCINGGEVVVLCGESGCGKTSLTRLINGLIPHYYSGNLSGDVLINGRRVREMPLYEIAGHVGSVFQNPRSQFYCMDTNAELAFGCENQGLPLDDIANRIEHTVTHLGIRSLMNRSIFDLSGGEKQKIACGSVHTVSPEIIVLDEPSSNLDPDSTKALGQIIRHWKTEGKTIVIAEHRLHYLSDVADRLVLMCSGRIQNEFSLPEAHMLIPQEWSAMGLRALSLDTLMYRCQYDDKVSDKIELSGFRYSYKRDTSALDIESLGFPKGQIIGVVGHNGAGKSTLARCLCGLNKRFKGKVRMGSKIYSNKWYTDGAYMVMQDVNHQLFTETVLDEVLLSMNEDNAEKVKAILASLNLLSMQEMHPMSLSGGQKQRVAIASAIASERDVIIFDEPTSGLDLRHMMKVAESLKQLKKTGKTVLVITHDLELLLITCDFVIHLEHGRVRDASYLDSNVMGLILEDWL